MNKQDEIILEGKVIRIEKTFYGVEIFGVPALEDQEIKCKLSGKMRLNKIRVIIGDKVTIKLNLYDLGTGTIVFRTK